MFACLSAMFLDIRAERTGRCRARKPLMTSELDVSRWWLRQFCKTDGKRGDTTSYGSISCRRTAMRRHKLASCCCRSNRKERRWHFSAIDITNKYKHRFFPFQYHLHRIGWHLSPAYASAEACIIYWTNALPQRWACVTLTVIERQTAMHQ